MRRVPDMWSPKDQLFLFRISIISKQGQSKEFGKLAIIDCALMTDTSAGKLTEHSGPAGQTAARKGAFSAFL